MNKKKLVALVLFLCGVTFFVVSIFTGSKGIDFGDFYKLLQSDERVWLIFEQIRLPRTLAAFLAGGALGLSGTLMQAVLKNPLASPFTLGISQASAFGASFAIIVLGSYSSSSILSGSFITTIFAFGASLVCVAIILYLGKSSYMKAQSLILAGVAIGALFSAGTMFLQYFATDIDVAATLFWTFGDLSKANLYTSLIIASVLLPALFWIL